MINNQRAYLAFLGQRGLDRRTRQDYLSRLRRVSRSLGLRISPKLLTSQRAVKRLARSLKGRGIPGRSIVDCAVAMQRYFECFHSSQPGRNHWVEVYWPIAPGKKRGEDGLLYLYFHRGKRNANQKVTCKSFKAVLS